MRCDCLLICVLEIVYLLIYLHTYDFSTTSHSSGDVEADLMFFLVITFRFVIRSNLVVFVRLHDMHEEN